MDLAKSLHGEYMPAMSECQVLADDSVTALGEQLLRVETNGLGP
jgi:hypothetical protein